MSSLNSINDNSEERSIGTISNIYSKKGIQVKTEDDRYYWSVYCDVWGVYWEQIPKYLFDALNKFQDEAS